MIPELQKGDILNKVEQKRGKREKKGTGLVSTAPDLTWFQQGDACLPFFPPLC
jgi:hypothetical protein